MEKNEKMEKQTNILARNFSIIAADGTPTLTFSLVCFQLYIVTFLFSKYGTHRLTESDF